MHGATFLYLSLPTRFSESCLSHAQYFPIFVCFTGFDIPFQHLKAAIDHPINVGEVLKSKSLFALGLFEAGAEEMFVVRDGVVSVLVQRTQ